jgi:hypothetical protein
MAVLDKIRSFFGCTKPTVKIQQPKSTAKTEEPKPTTEAAKKEVPQAPEKGSSSP